MRNTILTILALTSLLILSCVQAGNKSSDTLSLDKSVVRECSALALNKCESLGFDEMRECILAAENACKKDKRKELEAK